VFDCVCSCDAVKDEMRKRNGDAVRGRYCGWRIRGVLKLRAARDHAALLSLITISQCYDVARGDVRTTTPHQTHTHRCHSATHIHIQGRTDEIR